MVMPLALSASMAMRAPFSLSLPRWAICPLVGPTWGRVGLIDFDTEYGGDEVPRWGDEAFHEAIAQACLRVPGAWLQFHGDETPDHCRKIARTLGRRWIRAARIPLETPAGEEPFDLLKYAQDYSDAQAVLLDAHVDGYGGGGKTFNWSQLPQNVNAHLVLSGGLNAANVTDGLRALRDRGLSLAVDVSSGVESAKGIKDAAKIHEFVRAVRAADAEHPL